MKPAIVMQTDFTLGSSVSTMFGVCRIIDPEVSVFNGTHNIRQFDVLGASHSLMYICPFWPDDTIFVSVVDPGVGTARRACVAKLSSGQYIVTPDNGALTYPFERIGITEIREIDDKHRFPTTRDVSIFHGRDLFAYVAAKLASGVITYEQVGPEYPVEEIILVPYARPVVKDGVISGMLTHSSAHFGLVDTNIPYKWMEENGILHGDIVNVKLLHRGKPVFDRDVLHHKSFGYVPEGEPVLVCSETQHMLIALNRRNIVTEYDLKDGPDYTMEIRK